MIERFMVLLLAVVVVLLASSAQSASRSRDWARTVRIFRYLQATVLDGRHSRAAIRNDIVFHCKAVYGEVVNAQQLNLKSSSSSSGPAIFTIRPRDIGAFGLLDAGHRLGFFIHGWEARNRNNIWMLDVLKTWARYEDTNLCVVDWTTLSQRDYMAAAVHIFDVGFTVAAVIESLEKTALFHRRSITLAGYSLGAHAAGFAGQRLGGEVDHIIGLDPAGPMFTVPADVGPRYRLDPSDAKFVQVIHTSGGVLGVYGKAGHADFYPNGGVSPQTNCASPFRESTSSRIVCSHSTAVKYFTYSMDREYPYVGYHCSSYTMFRFGLCSTNTRGRFGIHTNRVAGTFYLFTTGNAPFVRKQLVDG